MRDLGAMGEDKFSFLCNSIGLIANPTKLDKTGWDYFVEFPESTEDKHPSDMKPPTIEVRVQVKASDKKTRKVQISLTNMIRLVKGQMPCFICLIEFNGKNEPQTIYLLHVGKAIIEKTLKTIRELSERQITKFNKRKMTITFSETDKIDQITGEALKQAIEKYVPNGMSDYINEKNIFLKTVGFESGWGQINFTVVDENPVEKMVDLTLGIVDEVKVSHFVGHHSRFNIVSKTPFCEIESGTIQLKSIKPNRMCLIRFKESKYGPGYTFKSKLYYSPLNKLVPEEHAKIRVEWNLFNLVIKPFTGEWSFSYSFKDESKETTMKELFEFVTFIDSLMRNQKGKSYLELMIEEGVPLLQASFSVDNVQPIELPLEIVARAYKIAERYKIENIVKVNLGDIMGYSKSIGVFYDAVIQHGTKIGITFNVDGGEIDKSKEVGVIFFVKTKIGQYLIGCAIGAVGIAINMEGRYEIHELRRKYFRDVIIESGREVKEDDLLALANQIAQQMEESGITPVIMES